MNKKIFFLILILVVSLNVYSVTYEKPERVPFSTLPSSIQTFVDTYFDNYDFLYALESTHYKLHFKGNIVVLFDITGDWTTVAGNGGAIPTGFIDSNILKVVTTKYPDKKITKVSKTEKKYEIKLINGTTITLDMEGNILKLKEKSKR